MCLGFRRLKAWLCQLHMTLILSETPCYGSLSDKALSFGVRCSDSTVQELASITSTDMYYLD